jgi:sugar phosphate isomerase/epimerase
MAVTANRRAFLASLAGLTATAPAMGRSAESAPIRRGPRVAKIKLSCNLYSFNEPLRSGQMTLDQVFEFCAELGFDAVDPTGYYLPGYPEVPPDTFLYETKRKAFRLGLDISGTGVRNDFTQADPEKRGADVDLVKRWVEVAAKVDAPVLRVFAGRGAPEGRGEAEVLGWVADCCRACASFGERHGVIITIQNHDDFLKTAAQVLALRERVGSDWFGLNVDIGSLRTGDPYEEIAALAPFADTWQIKEQVYRKGVAEETNVGTIVRILRESGYRGYIPLETLGAGDPKPKLRRFLDRVRQALA